MSERPKCQYGKHCENKGTAIAVVPIDKKPVFVCGKCYQAIAKMYKAERFKEMYKELIAQMEAGEA